MLIINKNFDLSFQPECNSCYCHSFKQVKASQASGRIEPDRRQASYFTWEEIGSTSPHIRDDDRDEGVVFTRNPRVTDQVKQSFLGTKDSLAIIGRESAQVFLQKRQDKVFHWPSNGSSIQLYLFTEVLGFLHFTHLVFFDTKASIRSCPGSSILIQSSYLKISCAFRVISPCPYQSQASSFCTLISRPSCPCCWASRRLFYAFDSFILSLVVVRKKNMQHFQPIQVIFSMAGRTQEVGFSFFFILKRIEGQPWYRLHP